MEKRIFHAKAIYMADNNFDIMFVNHEKYFEQAMTDCALLGAAPDLLAALENMVASNGKRGGDDDALLPADQQDKEVAQAMQAIAKAKGEKV